MNKKITEDIYILNSKRTIKLDITVSNSENSSPFEI